MFDERMLLALLNLFVCSGIAVMSFCRLNAMPRGMTLVRIAPYALMLTGALVSASQPWLDQWPTRGQVFYSVAVFVYFFSMRSGAKRSC